MINEQIGTEQDSTETIDPTLIQTLTESCLQDSNVRQELKQNGFTQFTPPYIGFTFDTIPPGISKEQFEQWKVEQQVKREEYLNSMDPSEKQRIKDEKIAYEATMEYLKPKVSTSLELLKGNRFGLRDIFNRSIQKEKVNSQDMIGTMKNHGIKVSEYPEQEIGFDGKDNHGEARYANNQWSVKFNSKALSDPYEVLHEFIAIESFDYYIRTKPSFRETVASLPVGLLVMTTGKSARESLARGTYIKKQMMTIPILESMYESVSAYGQGSEFLRKFSDVINK